MKILKLKNPDGPCQCVRRVIAKMMCRNCVEFSQAVLLFLFLMCVVCVRCDNITDKYPSGNFQTRNYRLLTFNTEKDDAISIELDFNVPFLHIPIKKTMDMAHGSFANINIGAVALAGMMAFSAAIIIPATYHLLMKKPFTPPTESENTYGNDWGKKSRRDEEVPSQFWLILSSIDRALSDNEIDSTSCAQRALCWTVKKSSTNLSKGKASSTDKIIDGLATNDWLNSFMHGSVFKAAIDTALSEEDCSIIYSQCKVNERNMRMFGKRVISAIYNRK